MTVSMREEGARGGRDEERGEGRREEGREGGGKE